MSTASWKVAAAAVFILAKVVSADPVKGPNGNYYELFPVTGPSMTWQEAKEASEKKTYLGGSGHLATIHSREEDLFAHEMSKDPETWVGGFQADNQTSPAAGWQWVHDEGPIPGTNGGPGYANWATSSGGEPNDCCGTAGKEDNEENSLQIHHNGEFGW